MKIAIIQTHPIQHFCPQFASYAQLEGVEIKVFFETDKGLNAYFDKDFKQQVSWSGIDLSGFNHQFLKGESIEIALNQYQPDAVIVYGYFEAVQKQATQFAIKHHIPVIYISDSENHQHRNQLKEWVKKLYLKPYFKKVDYCLSVGDANEEVYRSYGIPNDRIVRMFFPINTHFFDQLLLNKKPIEREIREQHHIPDNHITLATIGKLVSWKRQRDLIDTLLELEKRGIAATGFIIGSGPDEAQIREACAQLSTNKAIVTGFVQPEEMARYLCATDIYIHPAEIEPHSLAISEAIYCGCPAIISDRCGSYGPTDDVQPGKNGFVYPVGDIKQLACLIESLANNPQLRNQFATQSTQLSRQHQALAHGEALRSIVNLMSLDKNT